MNMPIEIYTDGSSLGNPGQSGLGYIIKYWEMPEENEMPISKEVEGKQGFRLSTNNRMEIMAGLYGIRAAIDLIKKESIDSKIVSLMSDSSYFCDAVNKRWIDKWSQNGWITSTQFPVKNKDLWEKVIEILKEVHNMGIVINISHVMGHNGNENNEKADKLAVSASKDTANHIIDEVYENSNKNKRTNFGYNTYR